jgi:phospholipase/carboxylesterase
MSISNVKYEPPIVLGGGNSKMTIIWLHGLGADGHDFVPVVQELKADFKKDWKFIFPHAPYRAITLNHGAVMRGWYDINSLSSLHREDETGVRESVRYIHELIEAEHQAGVPYEKIILAGFSQGGAIALYAGLTLPIKIGGVIALSTYVPISSMFQKDCTKASQQTPILMIHGTEDSIISLAIAQRSLQLLREESYSVDFVKYPMDHTVCFEEIGKISSFLTNCFAG